MTKLFLTIILASLLFSCKEDPTSLACYQEPIEIYEDPHDADSLLLAGQIDQVTKDCCPGTFVFYLPTAFTPNGDKLNDVFKPFGLGYEVEYMKFERNGQVILVEDSQWDGSAAGGNAPQGLYNYSIELTTWANETRTITGQVALIVDDEFDKCDCYFEDMLDPTRGFISGSQEGC